MSLAVLFALSRLSHITRTFVLVVVDDTIGISVKGSVSLASSSLETDGGTLLSLDKIGTRLS